MSDRMYSADRALPGVCDHVPYVLDAAAVDAVAAAVDSSGLRVRSINGDIGDIINRSTLRRERPATGTSTCWWRWPRPTGSGRVFLVLLASAVAISAWALFPTTVERGIYVPLLRPRHPLPQTSTQRGRVSPAIRSSSLGQMHSG